MLSSGVLSICNKDLPYPFSVISPSWKINPKVSQRRTLGCSTTGTHYLSPTYLIFPIEVAQSGLNVGIVFRHVHRSAGSSQIGGGSFVRAHMRVGV